MFPFALSLSLWFTSDFEFSYLVWFLSLVSRFVNFFVFPFQVVFFHSLNSDVYLQNSSVQRLVTSPYALVDSPSRERHCGNM
jgi:hypothetical protein